MNDEHVDVRTDVTPSNVQIALDGFTQKDVARAITQLAYRRAYNERSDVKAARKERQVRLAAAMRYVREHPELRGAR